MESKPEIKFPEFDPEQDDLHNVATKLGVENHQGKDRITPTEQQLFIINREIDDAGNTILMKFAVIGKSDVVELLLKFEGINVNHENEDSESAAKVAKENNQPACLLKLLEADSLFPGELCADDVEAEALKEFLQKREDLHEAIANGDIEKFKKCLGNPKPSNYLNNENESALYVAAENRQVEIYAHLISIGARFRDKDEEGDCDLDESFLENLNDLLEDQFLKVENYEVLKLLHRSKSPQPLTEERYGIVKGMYDYLGEIQLVRLIMKVLEYEDIDIVFDFENVHTNNVYCMNNSEVQGLTVTPIKRIFIAAKKCLSTAGVCKEVAGVLAHELCHMAMETLYKNDAKPYVSNAEAMDYVIHYESIVETLSKIAEIGDTNLDEIIEGVYKCYPIEKWHSELVVRVPHILAAYGEEEGMDVFQTQAKDLYDFYMRHVVPDSKGYSDPRFYKKALCGIESIHSYYGCISEVDKETNPLRMPLKKYTNSLINVDKIHLIITNIVRLCALNIYHQMKLTHRYQIDRKCLFLRLEVFKRHEKEILKAFSCSVCRLMVLIRNDKYVDIDEIQDYFSNSTLKNKEVILVVSKKCEILDKSVVKQGRCLDYLWNDLSEKFKQDCLLRTMKFKGNETRLNNLIDIGVLSRIVDSDDLKRVTAEETLILEDGKKDEWKGYRRSYYIDRELAVITVDLPFLREPPESTIVYITGLTKEQYSAFNFDDNRVLWLNDTKNEVDYSKQILIHEVKKEKTDSEVFDSIRRNDKHWYHFSDNKFHLVSLRGKDDIIYDHLNRTIFTEIQLIESFKNRIVLISDDPGTGKSTLLSSLLRRINEHPLSWVARINLLDYAVGDTDDMNSLSLEQIKPNIKPDAVLDIFFRLAGFKSKLDIYLMKQICKSDKYGKLCKVFLDGYDEVSSCYKEKVMKLLEVLINETRIQIWITTRVHERIDLQVVLGTCAFSLVQFSEEKMIEFLDKLWKHNLFTSEEIKSADNLMDAKEKLKEKLGDILSENDGKSSPLFESLKELESELKDDAKDESWDEDLRKLRVKVLRIDFKPFAYEMIRRSSIKDEEIKFMGIPLHLFMVGSIAFDQNFQFGDYSNMYDLYLDFVERKINIYWREKEKNVLISKAKKSGLQKLRERVYSLHIALAKIILKNKKGRNIDQKNVEDEDDLGVAVGILTKSGENYQFIHRTFAEFFFAEWVLWVINGKRLMEVMFEERYDVVRTFLASALDREDTKIVLEEYLTELDMEYLFHKFVMKETETDFHSKKIFRKISEVFKKKLHELYKQNTVKAFVYKLSKLLKTIERFDYKHYCFLRRFLTYEMREDLYGEHLQLTFKWILNIVRESYENEVWVVLIDIESIFQSRGYEEPLSYQDDSGYGLLHCAACNSNDNIFLIIFEFYVRVLEEEELKKCILAKTKDGSNIMHCSATRGALNILDICYSIEGKVDVEDLLTAIDDSGKSVLHILIENRYVRPFIRLLDLYKGFHEGETLKILLLQEDDDGKTILHYLCRYLSCDSVDEVFRRLRSFLGRKEFRNLSKRRDKLGYNIFHFLGSSASLYGMAVFEKYLLNEDLIELLLQVDNSGRSCLQLIVENDYLRADVFDGNVRELSRILGPENFRELVFIGFNDGTSFYRILKEGKLFRIEYKEIIDIICKYLNESAIQELLNGPAV